MHPIDAAAAARAAELDDAIELVCEQMLVTPGDAGVLVLHGPLGSYSVQLSPEVPFGQIHHRQVA